jgi:hypothetical protein
MRPSFSHRRARESFHNALSRNSWTNQANNLGVPYSPRTVLSVAPSVYYHACTSSAGPRSQSLPHPVAAVPLLEEAIVSNSGSSDSCPCPQVHSASLEAPNQRATAQVHYANLVTSGRGQEQGLTGEANLALLQSAAWQFKITIQALLNVRVRTKSPGRGRRQANHRF